jgi:Rieske Fe-S protein
MSVPLWSLLAGCNGNGKAVAVEPLAVPLEKLPLHSRVLFEYNGRGVEIVRTENRIRARVMLCTHQGCNIRWDEEEGVYICACHEGRFNDEGQPVYGPPREPLRELNVTRTETGVRIEG